MFPKLCRAGLGLSRGFARLLGNEIDVVVTEHEIKLDVVDPDKTDELGRAWDDSHFTAGNIHLANIANPIKPEPPSDESEHDYIMSERYKSFMKQTLMEDIVNEGMEESGLTLLHVIVLLTTVQFAATAVILWFVA